MLRLVVAIVSVLSDSLRFGVLFLRSSNAIRAENLVLRRQLAGYIERGIKPKCEISLGGSRLNRFMKDVESVTGRMGEGEAMATAEEAVNVAAALEETPASAPFEEMNPATAGSGPNAASAATAPPAARPEPWSSLLQFGAELVAALAPPVDGAAAIHPWIKRDPATGARSIEVPLPPPEMLRTLAGAFSAISDALLRTGGQDRGTDDSPR